MNTTDRVKKLIPETIWHSDPFSEERPYQKYNPFELAKESARRLAAKTSKNNYDVAIILGSGLSSFAETLTGAIKVSFKEVGLPTPKVSGHSPHLYSVEVLGLNVLIFAGRVHGYEEWSANELVASTRLAGALGVNTLIVSNAAGSLSSDLKVGDLVLLSDHINLTGRNPLLGAWPELEDYRFVDMSDAYSPDLREKLPSYKQGVYTALLGPSYETPAEIRYLQTIGSDLVGMSTVLETIAARQQGMEVLGFSLVTNQAAGLGEALDHAEVTREGKNAEQKVASLVQDVLELISKRL